MTAGTGRGALVSVVVWRLLLLLLLLAGPGCGSFAAWGQEGYVEPHPLTDAEARDELARFHDDFDGSYMAVVPGAELRSSGIIIRVRTARVVRGKLRVTGTITNIAAAPRGDYAFLLNQSYEEQVARYRKEPVGYGVCAGPCMTSHDERNLNVRSFPAGHTEPYTLVFPDFTRLHRHLKPSDMIFWINFSPG